MEERDTLDGRRRIDHLAEILSGLLSQVRVQAVYTFDSWTRVMKGSVLPDPSGSTALHVALEQMGTVEPKPAKLIVICDGEVDSEVLALAEAKRLGVPIDGYYVGPDGDKLALAFMQKLAQATGGDSGEYNIARHKQLTDRLLLRITGPRPAC